MARRRFDEDEASTSKKFDSAQFKKSLQVFSYIRPYRWSLIIGLVLLFLSSMVFMLFPYLSGLMIDIAQGKSNLTYSLGDIGWVLLAVLVAQGLVSYFRVTLFAKVSERGIADLRKAVFQKIITLPMTFFEQNRVGELVSRITSDIERLYDTFSITIAEFLRQIIILIVGVIFLAITTPKLALIMLGTFPIIVVAAMFFGRIIRRLSKDRQNALAETNTILSESMQAISAVKSFTNELYETRRYGFSIDKVVTVAMKYASGRAIFSVFIITVLFGALFFIIWEGANMVSSGNITAGQLVSFVSYTAILGGAIAGLGSFYTEILGAIGATERILDILNMESEVNVEDKINLPAERIYGNIEYRNVHFSYPSRSDVKVLDGIDFKIQAGQKIAIVGTSGAGKSTIIQLLLQFHKLTDGAIYIDGKNIYDYNLTAIRENMAIVPQEVLLFGGTIRENIAYGKPDATEQEIIAVAQKANAWEFISTFPEGLNTVVGERGIKLSGGQRQRIAIARAILKDPAILILDEATSSLDAESEKVVQEALYELMRGRTSIIIAHRLATIRDVDCIYVLGDGKIIEQGTHEELSLLEDGLYNNLAKLQFEMNRN
ncbi:MAG: ATP-binding cassette domain-containing protein [Saprospiraceae bacterium]|nr:ATP-binding cassette domain-containing protein [Saprospiraceae bacterium]